MDIWIIIPAIIVLMGVILGLIVFYMMRTKKDVEKETDYQVIFTVGFIWFPVGVVFMNTVNPALGIALMALGIVYIAIGLAHRDTWKINKNDH